MKYILFIVALLVANILAIAPAFGQTTPEYIEGQVYFKLTDNTSFQANPTSSLVKLAEQLPFLLPLVQTYGIDSARATFHFSDSPALKRTLRLYFHNTSQTTQLLQSLGAISAIEYAERVPLLVADLSPNDLGTNTTSGQWGLHKIKAPQAWDLAQGYATILVAVVDNAIQTTHTDLASKIWPGWDVADNDNNPNPPNTSFSHGTHVSGIVGAATNNGTGIASIGFNTSVMPVKATRNTDPYNYITFGYEGIIWAADHGANVINTSWGGSGYSTTGLNAVNYAWSRGATLVAAAGNSNSSSSFYPAAYPNVIAVAATDINDYRASFSNYGTYIDVCAPGVSIKSTMPTNTYGSLNGTSMASPMVAGLAGLLFSAKPIVTRQEVIDCLLQTADNINALNPSYIGKLGSGRINAFEAVKCLQAGCPDHLTMTQPWSSGTYLVSTDITLTATNQLSGTALVKYFAGSWIELLPGFSANCTSFEAKIQGCTHFTSNQIDDRSQDQSGTETQVQTDLSESADGFLVFPNPTFDDLNMRFDAPIDNPVQIRLTDLQGKILRAESLPAGETACLLHLSDLPPGIYLLGVQKADARTIYRKVVKQ